MNPEDKPPAPTDEEKPAAPPPPSRLVVEPVSQYGAAPTDPTTRVAVLLLLAFIIAILYFAQEVLLPMALGALLTFLLAIPAARLERLGLKRVWAAVIVAGVAFAAIAGVGYIIVSQLVDLAAKLPKYEENLRAKALSLRPTAGGTFTRIRQTFADIRQEMARPHPAPTTGTLPAETRVPATSPESTPPGWDQGLTPPGASPLPQPIPVKVVETERSALDVVRAYAGPLLAQLGTLGIVVIFVLFMLIQREDLRDRIVRLAGQRRITITTQALDEAAARVSRYLLMQFIINVTYGIPVALGLWLIGLPNALLWGLLATLLRFIPYVGPWVAALMPIGLSLAVFNGWWQVILVVGLFLVLELISNNIMEPLLYGHSTGLTPFAVLVSAVFWTWLWGGVGLFMATPLTVCLVVLSRYVPQLHFIEVLLGDEPVLSPSERLYQRLLAMDMDEAVDLAEEESKGRSLVEIYDELLLPALAMAERDRHRGTLMGRRSDFAMAALGELVEDMSHSPERPAEPMSPRAEEREKARREEQEEAAQIREAAVAMERGEPLPLLKSEPEVSVDDSVLAEAECRLAGRKILIVSARDDADELAGVMLANLLNRSGAQARTIAPSSIGMELVETAAREQPDAVVVSAMPPLAVTGARLLARRIRSRLPETRLIVALWRAEGNMDRCRERLKNSSPDALVTTLAEALTCIPPPPPTPPAGEPAAPACTPKPD